MVKFGFGRLMAAMIAVCAMIGLSGGANAQQIQLPPDLDPEDAVLFETAEGPVIIRMFPEKAPQHVERIKTLSRQGFYNGVIFHRVIDGFMAQTGDPTGTGRGSSPLPDLPAEFNDTTHKRGTVSMARATDPNSANSQFFIMFDNAGHLDGKYTVWGEVVYGMEFVDKIPRGQPADQPGRIERMMVLSDVFKAMGVDPEQVRAQQAQAEAQARAAASQQQPDFEMPEIPKDLDIVSPVFRNP